MSTSANELDSPYALLLRYTGLTQVEFCKRAGFSRTTLQYLIAGQMNTISRDQIQALSDACVENGIDAPAVLQQWYGTQSLREAYETWRQRKREAADAIKSYEPKPGEGWMSPFRKMVMDTAGGENAFSRLLAVPQARVLDYAAGKVPKMPQAIHRALRGIGYEYINTLLAYQDRWLAERTQREAKRG